MSNAVLSMAVVSRYEIKFCIVYPAICVYSFNHTTIITFKKCASITASSSRTLLLV